ncbi:MAG: hypothetical protein SFX73_26670 [Kofleriaceae bacterium]|nr:hypothetical protein [Kofleriaceae bacterium]
MRKSRRLPRWVAKLLGLLLPASEALAEDAPESAHESESAAATELAKQTQNPVADLFSIPLQFNFNSGGGLGDRNFINLNIQPVIPIHLTEKWNLIARPIIPINSAPTPRGDNDLGLGDIEAELFFTSAKARSFVWGVGPVFSLPTATLDVSTTGSWAVGPAALALYTGGPWVVGALATQLWTYADNGNVREVNRFLVQPFINFNLGKGWALSSAPFITANWGASAANTWTVPLGGGVTWTTKFGRQAMNIGVAYYRNVERPDDAPSNQLRFVLAFLFPDKKPPPAPSVAESGPITRPDMGPPIGVSEVCTMTSKTR